MIRLVLVMAPLIVLASCKTENPAFCMDNPEAPACRDAGGPAGGSCKATTDCKDPMFPVCNTDKGACAQCFGTSHDACTGVTPRCDVDTCAACVDDTQDCGQGGLCLPTGACAAADSIVHVTSNGSTDSDCGTTAKPCTLDQALTLAASTPSKIVIKLDDAGTYTPAVSNFVVDANITIDMRVGATLHKKADGPLLSIMANRTVTLLGGTIESATGMTDGDGILCNGNLTVLDTTIKTADRSGINAASGCNLTVTHASISGTGLKQFVAGIVANGNSITLSRSLLVSNRGGGIAVNSGTFVVIGNAFLNNGEKTNSLVGGIAISAPQNPINQLDFNTIASNTVQDGSKGGAIDCTAGAGFSGLHNIVWNNKEVNLLGITSQVSGSCKYAYSDFGPAPALAAIDGGHNLNMDPLLVNEMSDPHLQMNSPAIGAADPGANPTGITALDIDGDARVPRTGKGVDIGADQYTAP